MIDKIVSSIISSGSAANLYRINEDWLVDDEFAKIEFIKSYYKDNEELPPFELLSDRFGVTYPVKCGRFPYEFKQLKERHIYGELSENIPKLIKSVKGNPTETLEKLRSFIMTVGNEKEARDLHFSQNARSRYSLYEERIGTKGVTYLSTGNDVLDEVFFGWNRNDLITIGGRGGLGKCMGKGTPILMHDLTVKNVEDVRVGDKLMGPDGTPRNVLSLSRGIEQMYWIRQNKGMDYRVNESHILSLKRRTEGTINISVKDFLKTSAVYQKECRGYRVDIRTLSLHNTVCTCKTELDVEKDVVDDYYGFTIDGDHLYCLEDGTVTHNTWLMLRWALDTVNVLPEDKGPILFLTNEISDRDIAERLDCMVFQLAYEKFLKGELSRREKLRYQSGLKALEEEQKRLVILYNVRTIREIEMKIRIYNPSIVFIDGSYLLEPKMQEGYEKIIFITRALKGINLDYNIPVVNSTQLKRSSGTKKSKISFEAQDDFAWGSSYTQDSDIALRAWQTPDMVYYKQIGLDFAKARRVKPGITLTWYNNLTTMESSFEASGLDKEEETTSPIRYKDLDHDIAY